MFWWNRSCKFYTRYPRYGPDESEIKDVNQVYGVVIKRFKELPDTIETRKVSESGVVSMDQLVHRPTPSLPYEEGIGCSGLPIDSGKDRFHVCNT